MAARFEILQPKPGEFRWVLTNQGRVLARSEAYTRRLSCANAMESFRKAAPIAMVVDTTEQPATTVATTGAGKAARTTGRVVGQAAAKVAEVPSLALSAVEKVVDAVAPTPRKGAARSR